MTGLSSTEKTDTRKRMKPALTSRVTELPRSLMRNCRQQLGSEKLQCVTPSSAGGGQSVGTQRVGEGMRHGEGIRREEA